MSRNGLIVRPAVGNDDFETVREIFREYAAALGVDLCFQGFDQELLDAETIYTPPEGRVLLAHEGSTLAGCVGVRRQQGKLCEMKRLYVRPPFRGRGLGRQLAEQAMGAARDLGYQRVCLDTLPEMDAARGLYASLGFMEIEAYYNNPLPGAMYLEARLDAL